MFHVKSSLMNTTLKFHQDERRDVFKPYDMFKKGKAMMSDAMEGWKGQIRAY